MSAASASTPTATRAAARKATSARKAPSTAVRKTAAVKPAVAAKKPAASKPVAKKVAAKPVAAKKSAAPVAAKAPKAKVKLVRDSFTMPASDFALIDALKERALGFRRPAKKSELLRAGLQALAALSAPQLEAALGKLEPLKTGRPKKDA